MHINIKIKERGDKLTFCPFTGNNLGEEGEVCGNCIFVYEGGTVEYPGNYYCKIEAFIDLSLKKFNVGKSE